MSSSFIQLFHSELFRSMTKGVMVSPTLVDMNNDGIRDIFMSAYDGTIRLYDGETLDIMWTTRFYRFETYRSVSAEILATSKILSSGRDNFVLGSQISEYTALLIASFQLSKLRRNSCTDGNV